jgi:hypothetical protein
MKLVALAFVGVLAVACSDGRGRGGAGGASACGEAVVIDTYVGGGIDPYFLGYVGDPTFGGDPSWDDPTYYDPTYATDEPGSDDPSSNGTDDSSGDNSGDTSGGDSNGDAVRLHVTSGPSFGAVCAPCTIACTFATPGGAVPVGQVAQAESTDGPTACLDAMNAIERSTSGAALSRCRSVDPSTASTAVDPGLGHVIASPMVGASSTTAGSGAGPSTGSFLRPPRADLGPER